MKSAFYLPVLVIRQRCQSSRAAPEDGKEKQRDVGITQDTTFLTHCIYPTFLILFQLQEDSPVAWSKLENVGTSPTKRSGHTLTMLGNTGYMFGGMLMKPPI